MKPNWHRYAVYAAIMIMEGSWAYTILALLNQSDAGKPLSVWGLLLIYPISFALNTALGNLRWHKLLPTLASWLLWIPVMLIIIKIQLYSRMAITDTAWLSAMPQAATQIFERFRPEILVFISSAVLWWMGRRTAGLNSDFQTAIAEFQFGFCILLVAFFAGNELALDQSASVFTAMIFFSFGLIGISIANAQKGNSWLAGWYQGHWSGLLLISIALILIMGFVVSIIVTPDLLNLIWIALKWLWSIIEKILIWLATLIPAQEPGQPLPAMPPIPGGEPDEELRLFQIPEVVLTVLRWGWSIMVGGTLLFTLWRVATQIFSWLSKRTTSPGAETEHLDGAFKADFFSFLKRILFKLLRIKLRLPSRNKLNVAPGVASVRQIYTHMLEWAKSGGHPRVTAQTPYEYWKALSQVLPEKKDDMYIITESYVNARYGLYSPTEGELSGLREIWHRIKQTRFKKIST